VVRRLENGGFSHHQGAILAEVLHDEIAEQVATKEHVDLVVDRASERLGKMIHLESKGTIKWVAGMMVVQTVAILTGTVGLVKLLL
jgi:hypothetical protein